MESVEMKMEVPKECYELGLAVKKLLIEVKKANADGFQAAQDIPQIILASLQDLMKGIEGVDKVGAEYKEAPVEAVMAVLAPVMDGVVVLLKKE